MNVLLDALDTHGLLIDGLIVLDLDSEGRPVQVVTVSDFESLFGSTDFSYDSLAAADDNGDGTTKGYLRFFDDWLAAGIL